MKRQKGFDAVVEQTEVVVRPPDSQSSKVPLTRRHAGEGGIASAVSRNRGVGGEPQLSQFLKSSGRKPRLPIPSLHFSLACRRFRPKFTTYRLTTLVRKGWSMQYNCPTVNFEVRSCHGGERYVERSDAAPSEHAGYITILPRGRKKWSRSPWIGWRQRDTIS